jgi:hemoglobin-like flavoprotein
VDDKLFRNSSFIAHSKHYVKMVDRAVGLLGPDIELLTEILMELGLQHHKFGVESSFYPPMGQALIATMEELLGDKFNVETREAWSECYQAMGYDMMRGGKNVKSL